MPKHLTISKGLSLPTEAVTQTFAILAKRGVGKTYTASVMIEEMLKQQLHVVVIDPIGVWWGLRTAADGQSPGQPIIVAGGEHGDIPLDATNGDVIANLIVDRELSLVIDLSLMRKGEQKRFMVDFAETLYHRNRTAMHLVLDEADEFAPQRAMGDEARLLGAIEDLVRRGRARGIGITLITQRPAVLNKNVLTQIEVLVAMRLTSPQDRNAINEWIKYHADSVQATEMIQSLPALPIGTAWFWSPGWLDLFKKVAIRKRETFDSSSTPEVGAETHQAGKMAPVDIDWLREQLAATIEKVEADDPKHLRRRIHELEQQLKQQTPRVEVKEVPYPVQVVPEAVVKAIDTLRKLAEKYPSALSSAQAKATTPPATGSKAVTHASTPVRPSSAHKQPTTSEQGSGEIKPLSLAARSILNVLAQYPDGRTKIQIAILSGYSKRGSGFANALSQLRSLGLISPAGSELITITATGRTAASDVSVLPKGKALADYWYGKLRKAERTILEVVIRAYPKGLDYEHIAEATGYSRTSSGFSNALSKLRGLELASGYGEVRANDVFFEK